MMMNTVPPQYQLSEPKSNRWVVTLGTILVAGAIVGLAVMFVAPRLNRSPMQRFEDKGRGLGRRLSRQAGSTAHQVKNAVGEAVESVQDRAEKVKKTAVKKAKK